MSIRHRKSGLKKGWTKTDKAILAGHAYLKKAGIATVTPKVLEISDNSFLIVLGLYSRSNSFVELALGKFGKTYIVRPNGDIEDVDEHTALRMILKAATQEKINYFLEG